MLSIVLVGFVLATCVVAGQWFRAASQRRVHGAVAAADARRWYEQLGAEVSTLNDDGSGLVRQALSDASERYAALRWGPLRASSNLGWPAAQRSKGCTSPVLPGLLWALTLAPSSRHSRSMRRLRPTGRMVRLSQSLPPAASLGTWRQAH